MTQLDHVESTLTRFVFANERLVDTEPLSHVNLGQTSIPAKLSQQLTKLLVLRRVDGLFHTLSAPCTFGVSQNRISSANWWLAREDRAMRSVGGEDVGGPGRPRCTTRPGHISRFVRALVLAMLVTTAASALPEAALASTRAEPEVRHLVQEWADVACGGNLVTGIKFPGSSPMRYASSPVSSCTSFTEVPEPYGVHDVSVWFGVYYTKEALRAELQDNFPRLSFPILSVALWQPGGMYWLAATQAFEEHPDAIARARAENIIASLRPFGFQK